MSARRKDIDDSDVRFMYEVKGMTQQEIADYYGVSQPCIQCRIHPEKAREWRENHKKETKERTKQWHLKHPGYNKQYWLEHPESGKEHNKEYWQTDNGKALAGKKNAARRQLGSIEFNKPFPGSERHHIDTDHIIHIPVELHHSIRHNLKTGKNMESINKESMDFLMYEICEGIVLRG